MQFENWIQMPGPNELRLPIMVACVAADVESIVDDTVTIACYRQDPSTTCTHQVTQPAQHVTDRIPAQHVLIRSHSQLSMLLTGSQHNMYSPGHTDSSACYWQDPSTTCTHRSHSQLSMLLTGSQHNMYSPGHTDSSACYWQDPSTTCTHQVTQIAQHVTDRIPAQHVLTRSHRQLSIWQDPSTTCTHQVTQTAQHVTERIPAQHVLTRSHSQLSMLLTGSQHNMYSPGHTGHSSACYWQDPSTTCTHQVTQIAQHVTDRIPAQHVLTGHTASSACYWQDPSTTCTHQVTQIAQHVTDRIPAQHVLTRSHRQLSMLLTGSQHNMYSPGHTDSSACYWQDPSTTCTHQVTQTAQHVTDRIPAQHVLTRSHRQLSMLLTGSQHNMYSPGHTDSSACYWQDPSTTCTHQVTQTAQHVTDRIPAQHVLTRSHRQLSMLLTGSQHNMYSPGHTDSSACYWQDPSTTCTHQVTQTAQHITDRIPAQHVLTRSHRQLSMLLTGSQHNMYSPGHTDSSAYYWQDPSTTCTHQVTQTAQHVTDRIPAQHVLTRSHRQLSMLLTGSQHNMYSPGHTDSSAS